MRFPSLAILLVYERLVKTFVTQMGFKNEQYFELEHLVENFTQPKYP